MPGFTEDMMHQGMAVDYSEVRKLSAKVRDIVSRAREVRVTTPAGTDLTALFGSKGEWRCCDGDFQPGVLANLPGGEVYAVPDDVSGRVVIDGCLGDCFMPYGSMRANPVSYDLKEARCVKGSVKCKLQQLAEKFTRYTFESDENSSRVGEFAIGTNFGVKKLIGNMLQDEKFPSVHLALGDPGSWTNLTWTSTVHLDGLMLNPTVVVDGATVIMRDGKFLL
jgi:leucyl aminopeptidase (aminopeptidase T)